MEKSMEFSYLLDFYGEMLTDKQRTVMEQYYNEDLSLAEIADNLSISRQGVRDAIKHSEAILLQLEQAVGVAARHKALTRQVDRLQILAKQLRFNNRENRLTSIRVEQISAEMLELLDQIETQEELADGV